MTDIQALKKAAEAAIEAGQPSYAHADYVDAVMRVVKDDPATVLELCRLAEIGERVERAAKGDENGYLEIPKFLRRGND